MSITKHLEKSLQFPKVSFKKEFFCLFLGALITFFCVWLSIRHYSYANQKSIFHDDLNGLTWHLRITALTASTDRIISVLGRTSRVFRVAVAKEGSSMDEELPIRMETLRQMTEASIVYLMNAKGDVVAATKSTDGTPSLRGKNYAFRPYFRNAMMGNDFVYPALGVTTSKRGIYFSSPILDRPDYTAQPEHVVGAIVVKSDATIIDQTLESYSDRMYLFTPEGVVFSSNDPSATLKYHPGFATQTDHPLPDPQQYQGKQPTDLPRLPLNLSEPYETLNAREYAVASRKIALVKNFAPWTLVALRDTRPWVSWHIEALTGLIVAVIWGLVGLYWWSVKRRFAMERFAQVEIEQSFTALKTIVNGVADGIAVIHAQDGRLLEANHGLAEMFGFPREELEGMKMGDLVSKNQPGGKEAFLKRLLSVEDNQTERYDWLVCRKSGSDFRVEGTIRRAHFGELPGILVVLRDMTERAKIEHYLVEAREAAEKASSAKGAFLAVMSHELRNPLTAIIGAVDLLRGDRTNPLCGSWLNIIQKSSDSLLQIINDVLDYSKIEAGMLQLDPREFCPLNLLKEEADSIRPKALQKGLTIIIESAQEQVPLIRADDIRIRQILVNLISNALKFTQNGTLTLRVDVSPQAAEPGMAKLIYEIQDTGIGIPEEKKKWLFQPFVQVDSSTTRRYGGTGLGLAICKKLCSLMGGDISLESKAGVGSTFRFYILAHLSDAREIEPSPETEADESFALKAPLKKIAIAEDDSLNATVLQGLLQRLGYEQPVHYSSGSSLLSAWTHGTLVDVVVMDVMMPEMDGVETTLALRNMTAEPLRPFIIGISAHAFEEDRLRCLKAGMNDYITKPIRLQQLMKALQRASDALKNQRD